MCTNIDLYTWNTFIHIHMINNHKLELMGDIFSYKFIISNLNENQYEDNIEFMWIDSWFLLVSKIINIVTCQRYLISLSKSGTRTQKRDINEDRTHYICKTSFMAEVINIIGYKNKISLYLYLSFYIQKTFFLFLQKNDNLSNKNRCLEIKMNVTSCKTGLEL